MPATAKRDIKEVWIEYKKTRTEELRNALMENYLHLVRYNAERIHVKLPDEVELDDLMSSGIFGLMDAIEAFDLERGVKFETYCAPRIRGAILDELRRQDHVPRSVRRKTRDITAARNALAAKLCRAPEDVEVAEALGVDVQTLWKWESDVEGAIRVPIDRPANDRGGESHTSPLDLLHTDPTEAIDERLGREQEVTMLRDAILKLKEQERTVLALYYFEELKLHEIAEILGLTESRVSQIRSKALARLRETVGVALAS